MDHVESIGHEQRCYISKCRNAILSPTEYMILVVYVADKLKYGLPWLPTKVKDQSGHVLSINFVALLRFAQVNSLRLYKMTDDHATSSNQIVESVHKRDNGLVENGPVTPFLYLQLDNSVRGNKCLYLLYVAWGVFQMVEFGVLSGGYTYSYIDKTFSATSRRLSTHRAITC